MPSAAAVFVMFCLAAAAAASRWAPDAWRWPAICGALFFAIFVAQRQIAAAIGRATEKKFNGEP